MICSSNCWSRSLVFRGGGGKVAVAGRGRGKVLLGMTCQVDHFGSLEDYDGHPLAK